MDKREKGAETHQLVGSVFDLVRKHAVIGCPTSATLGVSLSKKPGGGSVSISLFASTSTPSNKSGLAFLIVAATLQVDTVSQDNKAHHPQHNTIPLRVTIPPTWDDYQTDPLCFK